MNYNYEQDKVQGDIGEQIIIRFLDTLNNKKEKLIYIGSAPDFKDKYSDYDLKYGVYPIDKDGKVSIFPKKSITFEVKTDYYPEDTGNMIIETKSWGRKSGITISKSDYYIYFYIGLKVENIWIISTDKLKEFLKDKKTHIVSGGDKGSNTFMYKIPRNEFRGYFNVFSYSDYDYVSKQDKVSQKSKDRVIYYSDNLYMKKYDDNIF